MAGPTMGYDDDPANDDNLVKLSPMTKDEANILWNVLENHRKKLSDAIDDLQDAWLPVLANHAREELAITTKMMQEIRPMLTIQQSAQRAYQGAAGRVTQEMLANEPGISIGGVSAEPEDTSNVELHGGGGHYRDIQQQPMVLDDEAANRVAEILVRRGRATMSEDRVQRSRELAQGWLHDHRVSPQQAPESGTFTFEEGGAFGGRPESGFEDITGLVDDLIGETVTDVAREEAILLVREADPELERLLAEEEDIERGGRGGREQIQRLGYELYSQSGGTLDFEEWRSQRFRSDDAHPAAPEEEAELEDQTERALNVAEAGDSFADPTPDERAYHEYLYLRGGYMSAPMTYDQWVERGRPG